MKQPKQGRGRAKGDSSSGDPLKGYCASCDHRVSVLSSDPRIRYRVIQSPIFVTEHVGMFVFCPKCGKELPLTEKRL